MRDWPPCPPIQRDSGRRSRPGVNPFISALTVARCPATFPGVWPQLRDTLSTSWSVGRGTGAFIYALSADESRPALAAPRHASTALFSCRFKCPCPPRRQRHFHGNAGRAYNTLHFASQSRVPNGGVAPFGNPHKKRRYATPPRGAYRLFLLSAHTAFSCYPALRLYRLSKSPRGIDVVSLTLGNSVFPLGNGLEGDIQLFRQLLLGQARVLPLMLDIPPDLQRVHDLLSLRAFVCIILWETGFVNNGIFEQILFLVEFCLGTVLPGRLSEIQGRVLHFGKRLAILPLQSAEK